jgi:hypothetical protein
VGENKFRKGNFVFVANEKSVKRQKMKEGGVNGSDNGWVALILEIRALDEDHVYARVYWMYWPEDLPKGTYCGRNIISGRQPYHGQHELIASNHSGFFKRTTTETPIDANNGVSEWLSLTLLALPCTPR